MNRLISFSVLALFLTNFAANSTPSWSETEKFDYIEMEEIAKRAQRTPEIRIKTAP